MGFCGRHRTSYEDAGSRQRPPSREKEQEPVNLFKQWPLIPAWRRAVYIALPIACVGFVVWTRVG